MPTVSPAQHRLMEAAAHHAGGFGGVSQKVGKEFVGKDEQTIEPRAAGTILVTPDGLVLLLKRNLRGDHQGEWCFPGGMIEDGETPESAAAREMAEETGFDEPVEINQIDDNDGFITHVGLVEQNFIPKLNDEHVAYAWAPLDGLPQPLHPGVASTVKKIMETPMTMVATDSIAFDRSSIRNYDKDGHLSIEMNPISKANICSYLGREIPRCGELGLVPDKIYKLLRDPEELMKGAKTFAGKPIMLVHKQINAYDHPREAVVGAVGTDPEFDDPYLRAPLTIWDGEAICLIDSGEQKELSSSYRYRADMTPGEYKGEKYDGVMRDIVGNHVALVKEGRAGDDVVVGDTLEKVLMSKQLMSRKAAMAQGALLVFLQPKLASDAKLDLGPILNGVTSKNFAEMKTGIAESIKKSVVLAKDASLDDLTGLLDKLENTEAIDELEPNSAIPVEKKTGEDDDLMTRLKAFLQGKIADDDMSKLEEMVGAKKATDEFPGKKPETNTADIPKAEDEEKEDMVSKKEMETAMDAAVQRASQHATKVQKDIHAAIEEVRPYVGKLAMAFDSAEEVFKTALKTLSVDTTDVHPSALRSILKAQPVPGSRKSSETAVAMDAASVDDFHKRFPDASRIGQQ